MLDTLTRIKAVREAGEVVRCHAGGKTTTNYNNAQHQYGVAMLYAILWPGDIEGLLTALVHDVPERWLGDIPAPVLRNNQAFRKTLAREEELISAALELPSEHTLTEPQLTRLKNADRLELFLWTLEEESRGNRNFASYRKKIAQMWDDNPPLPEVMAVAVAAVKSWERLPETFEEITDVERE